MTKDRRIFRSPFLWGPVGLIIGGAIAGSVIYNKPPPPPCPQPQQAKYDFEKQILGWLPETTADSRACVRVAPSDEKSSEAKSKEGCHSLKLSLHLNSDDKIMMRGEAWVDMKKAPPSSGAIPIALAGQTITAWVYCPAGSRGDNNKPNGVQLFVKDDKWKSLYGTWTDVFEETWFQVSLDVGSSPPANGFMMPGFNPKKIVALGIKVALGGGSTARYKGDVYVDAINW